eukprot:3685505-Prymnesium_polylepis.1
MRRLSGALQVHSTVGCTRPDCRARAPGRHVGYELVMNSPWADPGASLSGKHPADSPRFVARCATLLRECSTELCVCVTRCICNGTQEAHRHAPTLKA